MGSPRRALGKAKRELLHALGSRLGLLVPLRAEGARWLRIPDDHVLYHLRRGSYERQELNFFRSVLRPGDTVLDIGANFGLYAILAARLVGREGRVLAFEPDPANLRYLRLNMLLNRQPRIEVLPVALGDEEGETEFICVSQGAYSALKVAEVPGDTSAIRVRQATLDAIAASEQLNSVDFIKMDVEGAELLVLQGGEDFFRKVPRALVMCEFNDNRAAAYGHTSREVYRWLREREYRWFRLSQYARLVPQPDEATYEYTNLVACPAEKLDVMAPWTNDQARR